MSRNEKEESETDSLRLTKDFFKRIVIQSDVPHFMTDDEGIIHCNIIEFLLQNDIIVP